MLCERARKLELQGDRRESGAQREAGQAASRSLVGGASPRKLLCVHEFSLMFCCGVTAANPTCAITLAFARSLSALQ
jgi:hypothetical protein